MGQHGNEWDSLRDSDGTPSLKRLAAGVLARDSGRDRTWDKPATRVPAPPLSVPPPPAPFPALSDIPGVPRAWCEGVARLAAMPAPDIITPARWAALAGASVRLLRDHGAELHAAGWDTIALFGLHAAAPMTHPPAWGLAWLLGENGEVLDLSRDAIGMRRGPDGARLAFRRTLTATRAVAVPAWALLGGYDG